MVSFGTIWGRTFFGIILLNYILNYRFVYVPNWPSDYIGAQMGASVANGSITFKIPVPFTDHKVTVEVSGELGGLGYAGAINVEEKRIELKATLGVGAGIALGVE